MPTHPAIVTVALGKPLELLQVSTAPPRHGEVRVRVKWVASSPLDGWQADAGLMVQHPQSLGDSVAGTVVEVGSGVDSLKLNDRVFGFCFHNEKERAYQVYVTAPAHLFGKVWSFLLSGCPGCHSRASNRSWHANFGNYLGTSKTPLAAAVTIPNNFVTAFYSLSIALGLDFSWPRREDLIPTELDRPILIWGASSSVGQFALQLLKYYGYRNVIGTASPKHHQKLGAYGAKQLFDYRDPDVVQSIRQFLETQGNGSALRILDCIDSKFDSLEPISKIATQSGASVAALLPVVITRSTPSKKDPVIIAPDPSKEAPWASGVDVHGVVTYAFEAKSGFMKDNVTSKIMPSLLAQGAIEPNTYQVIEAPTLLDRAQTALDIMTSGSVSGERLVWRVWTANEFPTLS